MIFVAEFFDFRFGRLLPFRSRMTTSTIVNIRFDIFFCMAITALSMSRKLDLLTAIGKVVTKRAVFLKLESLFDASRIMKMQLIICLLGILIGSGDALISAPSSPGFWRILSGLLPFFGFCLVNIVFFTSFFAFLLIILP